MFIQVQGYNCEIFSISQILIIFYSSPVNLTVVFLSVLEGQEKRKVQYDFREEDKDESKEVKERQTGNLTSLL